MTDPSSFQNKHFGRTIFVMAGLLCIEGRPLLHLLPALPSNWPTGRVEGLRARGGFEADMEWKEGKLVTATIRSLAGKPCQLRYGAVTRQARIGKEQSLRWDGRSG